MSKSTSGFELTISKCLSNIVLHLHYIGAIELGGIHKLTLVGAACQLTEEVHQIEETRWTPAHRCSQCVKQIVWKKEMDYLVASWIIKQVKSLWVYSSCRENQ